MATTDNDVLGPISLMKSHRDPAYLGYIRKLPCCVSGRTSSVVAHHVRIIGGGGTGLKPSDYLTVPLDFNYHRELHDNGEANFWMGHKLVPADVIENMLAACLPPGTSLDEIFNSPTAMLSGHGRVRALIESVATWRGTK